MTGLSREPAPPATKPASPPLVAASPIPGTVCTWEVLSSNSSFPVIACGVGSDPGKAKSEVERALATPEAGIGQLVRIAVPGYPRDHEKDDMWPPFGQIQQCRRNSQGGYSWQCLHPPQVTVTITGPAVKGNTP